MSSFLVWCKVSFRCDSADGRYWTLLRRIISCYEKTVGWYWGTGMLWKVKWVPVKWFSKIVSFIVVCFVCLMVFSTTFNNISFISWQSVLLVEETGGPGENHWRPVANHWQTLSHNNVHLALIEIQTHNINYDRHILHR